MLREWWWIEVLEDPGIWVLCVSGVLSAMWFQDSIVYENQIAILGSWVSFQLCWKTSKGAGLFDICTIICFGKDPKVIWPSPQLKPGLTRRSGSLAPCQLVLPMLDCASCEQIFLSSWNVLAAVYTFWLLSFCCIKYCLHRNTRFLKRWKHRT